MPYKRGAAKFVAGDHLRVWRPLGPVGYYHHGIYIDDARVVQFGGRIGDKHQATIGAVPLSTFENGGTAKLVPHGGRTRWGTPRFDAIPRDVTVRRAERLVEAHPEGLYTAHIFEQMMRIYPPLRDEFTSLGPIAMTTLSSALGELQTPEDIILRMLLLHGMSTKRVAWSTQHSEIDVLGWASLGLLRVLLGIRAAAQPAPSEL